MNLFLLADSWCHVLKEIRRFVVKGRLQNEEFRNPMEEQMFWIHERS